MGWRKLPRFDAQTSQDEESYDGDVSRVDKQDVELVPDEEDGTQLKTLNPAGDDMLPNKEGQEEANKNGDQTAKPADKKPAQKCGNQASSGS